MCSIDNGSDVGHVLQRYDICICDLGAVEDKDERDHSLGKVRPCVIISSEYINSVRTNKYFVLPIRTEHTMDANNPGNADYIVSMREDTCGRLYIPIKMGIDGVRFIDVTQLVRVESGKVLRYCFHISNKNIQKLIDRRLNQMLFERNIDSVKEFLQNRKNIPSAIINDSKCQEWIINALFDYSNGIDDTIYDSDPNTDIKTMIRKFDIYYCKGSNNRKYPYVIVQSDSMNHELQNNFLVAPIVSVDLPNWEKETIDNFVYETSKMGKSYVPFKFGPKLSDTRFVSLGETSSIHVSNLCDHKYAILNKDARALINHGLMNLMFNGEEVSNFTPINTSMVIESKPIAMIEEVKEEKKEAIASSSNSVVTENEKSLQAKPAKKKGGKKPKPLPTGFSVYYVKYKNGKCTIKYIAQKLGVTPPTVRRYIERYEELKQNAEA